MPHHVSTFERTDGTFSPHLLFLLLSRAQLGNIFSRSLLCDVRPSRGGRAFAGARRGHCEIALPIARILTRHVERQLYPAPGDQRNPLAERRRSPRSVRLFTRGCRPPLTPSSTCAGRFDPCSSRVQSRSRTAHRWRPGHGTNWLREQAEGRSWSEDAPGPSPGMRRRSGGGGVGDAGAAQQTIGGGDWRLCPSEWAMGRSQGALASLQRTLPCPFSDASTLPRRDPCWACPHPAAGLRCPRDASNRPCW